MARMRIALVLAAASCLYAGTAGAQDFPSRSLKIIVPLPAGGPVDVLARAVGEGLRARTGQTVVIENRPGGNTRIGVSACRNAAPDGHTICMFSSSTIVLRTLMDTAMHETRELVAVSNIVIARSVLLVRHSVPATSFKELVAYSQQNPDKLSFGSFGVDGEPHAIAEWLKKKTGLRMTNIPYAGVAPALVGFERGDVQLLLPAATSVIVGRVKSGQARGLLMESHTRHPLLPDVPTFVEAGLPPLDYETWFGMFAPPNTPADRVQRLSREIAAIVHSQEFLDRFVTPSGFVPVGDTPAEFKKAIETFSRTAEELVTIAGRKIAR